MSDPVPARLLYPGSGGHLGHRVVELRVEAGVERPLIISVDGLGDIILSNNSVFG